jgi:hypothetical protein
MSDKYPDDYKHFDKLIWQLPSWSTAIFLLSVTGLTFIAKTDLSTLIPGIPMSTIAFVFLGACLFFQLAIFNALVRFRYHQSETMVRDDSVSSKWWYSGQFWLQTAVITQAGSLSYSLLSIVTQNLRGVISIGLMSLMFFYSIISVYYKQKK